MNVPLAGVRNVGSATVLVDENPLDGTFVVRSDCDRTRCKVAYNPRDSQGQLNAIVYPWDSGRDRFYDCCGFREGHAGCWRGPTKGQIEPYLVVPRDFGRAVWSLRSKEDIQMLWDMPSRVGSQWKDFKAFENMAKDIERMKAALSDPLSTAIITVINAKLANQNQKLSDPIRLLPDRTLYDQFVSKINTYNVLNYSNYNTVLLDLMFGEHHMSLNEGEMPETIVDHDDALEEAELEQVNEAIEYIEYADSLDYDQARELSNLMQQITDQLYVDQYVSQIRLQVDEMLTHSTNHALQLLDTEYNATKNPNVYVNARQRLRTLYVEIEDKYEDFRELFTDMAKSEKAIIGPMPIPVELEYASDESKQYYKLLDDEYRFTRRYLLVPGIRQDIDSQLESFNNRRMAWLDRVRAEFSQYLNDNWRNHLDAFSAADRELLSREPSSVGLRSAREQAGRAAYRDILLKTEDRGVLIQQLRILWQPKTIDLPVVPAGNANVIPGALVATTNRFTGGSVYAAVFTALFSIPQTPLEMHLRSLQSVKALVVDEDCRIDDAQTLYNGMVQDMHYLQQSNIAPPTQFPSSQRLQEVCGTDENNPLKNILTFLNDFVMEPGVDYATLTTDGTVYMRQTLPLITTPLWVRISPNGARTVVPSVEGIVQSTFSMSENQWRALTERSPSYNANDTFQTWQVLRDQFQLPGPVYYAGAARAKGKGNPYENPVYTKARNDMGVFYRLFDHGECAPDVYSKVKVPLARDQLRDLLLPLHSLLGQGPLTVAKQDELVELVLLAIHPTYMSQLDLNGAVVRSNNLVMHYDLAQETVRIKEILLQWK